MANRHGLRWSADEDSRLRRWWGLLDLGQIALRLGRSVSATRARGALLGLGLGAAPGHISMHEAARRAGYHDASFARSVAWWRARGHDVPTPVCLGVRAHRGAGIWRTIDAYDAADIAAAYAQSELPGQAAARLGLTPWTLARRAKAAGHKSAPMLRLMPVEWDALRNQPKKRGPTE